MYIYTTHILFIPPLHTFININIYEQTYASTYNQNIVNTHEEDMKLL